MYTSAMANNIDNSGIHLPEKPGLLELRCAVQHYEWGGFEYIQHLIQCDGDQRPYAELWIGAHPDLPSDAVVEPEVIPLNMLIEEVSEFILGAETSHRFNGCLPFLFKVLSARYPLSIQVHPDAQQAREGFALEKRILAYLTNLIGEMGQNPLFRSRFSILGQPPSVG